jgi:type I restriction enzyme S subunit
MAQARGQVAKLTPSLLARAFAGQLVRQNPTDEPATKLVERIKHLSLKS